MRVAKTRTRFLLWTGRKRGQRLPPCTDEARQRQEHVFGKQLERFAEQAIEVRQGEVAPDQLQAAELRLRREGLQGITHCSF